jgi:hypothetical protein
MSTKAITSPTQNQRQVDQLKARLSKLEQVVYKGGLAGDLGGLAVLQRKSRRAAKKA